MITVGTIEQFTNNTKPHSYRLANATKKNNESHDFDVWMSKAINEVNNMRDRALRKNENIRNNWQEEIAMR